MLKSSKSTQCAQHDFSITTAYNNGFQRQDSIVSETSETQGIKFAKKECCNPTTCICVTLALLFITLGAATTIFYGLDYLNAERLNDRVFLGKFSVISGNSFTDRLSDTVSDDFETKSQLYKTKLEKLYNESVYSNEFLQAEVVELESDRKYNKVNVHFNLRMSRGNKQVDASDLYVILIKEITSSKLGVFQGLKIDQRSVQVQERISSDAKLADPWIPHQQYPGYLDGLRIAPATSPSTAMNQSHCEPIELEFCKNLSYNVTYYPNMVGHMNIHELQKDLTTYRQVIDFECYSLAQEFICQILQPGCQNDAVVSPCRNFCEEFWKSCKNLLPKIVYDKINCSTYPKYDGSGSCKPKPNCGINPTHTHPTNSFRSPQSKDVKHGDWPWHIMLMQNGKHVCDGTLVDHTWVITSSVCLKKYPNAYWTVKLGSGRLASVSPYDRVRLVTGVIKSPFEPEGVTLLKLHKPVNITDYASPVCLPNSNTNILPGDYCFTLGWDVRDGEDDERATFALPEEQQVAYCGN
ncbi:uncharacterized protein LOC111086553 isoform X2 [Limulus polyphemus]|uniref:Uncharacterized protein LOC111086553 isoform X2 n=1 Tax=Limulus polyphemus TaxID=6850 RepID=A0ABM1SPE5_LIMPO|nr:uncharacterized protein LOC111086553 isoform X2 [Limulus polyphemus]